ncbi:uncharacterized protein LOC126481992 [Schistocerca serialis cubense]|uniref:uncharacterized protein LOC126481992 n=1 Tax=Schistocerca serialis cubense TaxID=2023355 RepID=UPI00214EE531|nr:uncharacterized protein LOC126481992 [Schistocerca serialis cubense]
MAAMSLGFIVLVTPWTLQEVVAACTGSKAPPFLDFLATWLALSHSFWSPFLFWLLDGHFRRVCRTLLLTKSTCPRKAKVPSSSLVLMECCLLPGKARCPGSPRDLECLSEQRWGEILERAVSSSSLQALQRLYGPPELPPPAPPPRALPEPPPPAGSHM